MSPPPSPRPAQQHSRINLSELKAQIIKKIGPERSHRYFSCLNRFFSLKLGKANFDKLCFLMLGRENLPLHNLLIRSILKNASSGRVPPPAAEKEASKLLKLVEKRSLPKEDGYSEGGPLPVQTPLPSPRIWGNGHVLPMSPRRVRSGVRDRRFKDRPSPLGRDGKTDHASNLSVDSEEAVGKHIMENGDWSSCDLKRPLHHHQGLAEQPENESDISLPPPTKRPRIKRSPPESTVSVHSKGLVDVAIVEDGAETDQANASSPTRSPVRAPLGIPFCSASVGGARRALPVVSSSSNFASSVDCGELSDTENLKKRMEQMAGAMGLNGVSTECANLLNKGLDVYLKQLIKSCIELKSGQDPIKQSVNKQRPHGNLINGVLPSHHMQIQSNGGSGDVAEETKTRSPISLLDFKVAMELNPQQLGEDWPLLLEKICLHSWEE